MSVCSNSVNAKTERTSLCCGITNFECFREQRRPKWDGFNWIWVDFNVLLRCYRATRLLCVCVCECLYDGSTGNVRWGLVRLWWFAMILTLCSGRTELNEMTCCWSLSLFRHTFRVLSPHRSNTNPRLNQCQALSKAHTYYRRHTLLVRPLFSTSLPLAIFALIKLSVCVCVFLTCPPISALLSSSKHFYSFSHLPLFTFLLHPVLSSSRNQATAPRLILSLCLPCIRPFSEPHIKGPYFNLRVTSVERAMSFHTHKFD